MKTHHWFLVIAVLVIVYVLMRGGEERYASSAPPLNYDRLAVSQGMTAAAPRLAVPIVDETDLFHDPPRSQVRSRADLKVIWDMSV